MITFSNKAAQDAIFIDNRLLLKAIIHKSRLNTFEVSWHESISNISVFSFRSMTLQYVSGFCKPPLELKSCKAGFGCLLVYFLQTGRENLSGRLPLAPPILRWGNGLLKGDAMNLTVG